MSDMKDDDTRDMFLLGVSNAFDLAGFIRFFATSKEVVRSYAGYLADVDIVLITEACLRLGEEVTSLPTPLDIRRECGRVAGLGVAPRLKVAWKEAMEYAAWQRKVDTNGIWDGKPEIHPAALEAMNTAGGKKAVGERTTAVQAQFRVAYGEAAAVWDRELVGRGTTALAGVDVAALFAPRAALPNANGQDN